MIYTNIVYKPVGNIKYRGIERNSPAANVIQRVSDELSTQYCYLYDDDGLIPCTEKNFNILCAIRNILSMENIETDVLVYDTPYVIESDVLSFIGFDVCGSCYHSFLLYNYYNKILPYGFNQFYSKLNTQGLFDDIVLANRFAEFVAPYSMSGFMEYDTNIRAMMIYIAK